MKNNESELQLFSIFTIFQAEKGKVNIDVFLEKKLEEISVCRDFRHTAGKIYNTKYLIKIFSLGKLEKNSVSANFAHTAENVKVALRIPLLLKKLLDTIIREFRIVQIEEFHHFERIEV